VSVLPPPDPECASCAARDERIGEQRELIGELQDALGAQAGQIAALKDQVARLERLISRNSGFSELRPLLGFCAGRFTCARRRF
jgi:hypothetical protein